MSVIDFVYDDIKTVSVSGLGSGDVRVVAGSDDKVTGRIDCSDPDYLQTVDVRQSLDQLRIGFPDRGFGRDARVEVELAVPAGTNLETATGSGDVTAAVALGAAKISTGSGDVDLTDVTDAQCSAGSGSIVLGRVTGATAQLTTGSGDVTVGEASASIQAKTASGDVTIHRLVGGRLRANTASGDIGVPSSTGSIEARAASGSISVGVAETLPAWLDLNSVTGEVRIDLDPSDQPAADQDYVTIRAATASGDITIYRA